jgi:iron complex outermembrane receptor protein
MKRHSVSFGVMAALLATGGLSVQSALAQDGADDEFIEEIVTTGSRSTKPRSAGDSPVPVDVINADDFTAMGNTADLTDNIKALVPSYQATPATGDGSAFVRPTSLRGTAPDQTLVLINGKRRHRSALVQFFAPAAGNGAHGPDIGMIPGMAIKRVEVLRDGAASQYGSDAIADQLYSEGR